MKTLGILMDNVSPKQINKEIFESISSIYKNDKNSSINLFVKNLNWPYKQVDYGIFKWIDYQNYEGPTIATNLELLNFVKETPNSNKTYLYLYSMPWGDCKISKEKTISLLTNPNIDVYCRVDYIKELVSKFGKQSKVCSLDKLIKDTLYGNAV